MPALRRLRRNRESAELARVPRKDRLGAAPVKVAVVVLVLMAIGLYLGFTKDLPFSEGYRLDAVVQTANSIRPNSAVRIAGVNVGKVVDVRRYRDTNMSVVQMEIQDRGLPIHKDATVAIRPRIFLEGNFFVDLQPGSPGAPRLEDGDRLSVAQTSAPVQLDEVLTTLQEDTRSDLQTFLEEYGNALQGDPAASDRLGPPQDPSARGETAAESLNDTFRDAGPGLRGTAQVNDALLGTEEGDLSKLIAGLGRVTAALGRNERVLQDMVVNFNRTMAIFGDEKANVSASLRQLSATIPEADRTLAELNAAFPSTRAFAREILPGVRETPATIDAAFPWIDQMQPLLSSSELGGVARLLRPTSRALATTTNASIRFFPQQELLSRCLTEVVLPAGDIKIDDGPFTTGVENYKEFWYAMPAFASEGQNFDGNGQYIRLQPGGGSRTLQTGQSNLGALQQYFNPSVPPLGTRPAYTGQKPPYRPDVACHTNALPDLNSARTGPADGSDAARAGGGRRP